MPRVLLVSAASVLLVAAGATATIDKEDVVLAAAKAVAYRFGADDAYKGSMPPALREYLPAYTVELVEGTGLCDSAARSLQGVLGLAGIESEQLNIAAGYAGGHSVLAVRLGDREVLVDPFFGAAAVDGHGRLAGIEHVRERLDAGAEVGAVLRPLISAPDLAYYGAWTGDKVFYAKTGSDIGISVDLPALEGRAEVLLGAPDGQHADVGRDGNLHGLTPYWSYLGVRYDRAWTRTVTAREAVVIEAHTIGPLEPRHIRSEPAPAHFDGSRVAWVLQPGESLTLYQTGLMIGGAQEVDYWRISPLRARVLD